MDDKIKGFLLSLFVGFFIGFLVFAAWLGVSRIGWAYIAPCEKQYCVYLATNGLHVEIYGPVSLDEAKRAADQLNTGLEGLVKDK